MHSLRKRALVGAVSIAGALAWTLGAAPSRAETDPLLSEIQTHFHATKKWFGMVSDLGLDRAADGTITPRFEMLHSKFVLHHDAAGQTLHARLPAMATGPHVVEFDGVDGFSVRTEELGMQRVPAEIHHGVIVYRGAIAGGDVLYKLTPTHVDEYIYLREPPAHLTRVMEFDTGSAVWKLREADTMIEVLGKDGIARLRMSAPLARAADGTRRRGTVHIQGRKVVLDIDLRGLRAPILVDPDWSTTGTMTVAHWGDAAWRRPDGRVMAVGGCGLTNCPASFTQSACGQVLANSDLWDPASGTWTSAAPMQTARTAFVGVPLPTGDMLVAGGCTATNCTQINDAGACLATQCTQTTALTERFSFKTGTWIAAGALATPRTSPMGAAIEGGDAIVTGGCDVGACTADTERWRASSNTWETRAPLAAPRGYSTATVLGDGRLLVIGGCADPSCAMVLGGAAVYDPVTDSWSEAGAMTSPRAGHSATLLGDGTVLVAGGCTDATCGTVLSSAEIWEAFGAGGGFAAAPSMAGSRHHHTATLLANGEVLMAGGADATGSTVPTSEVYLPIARQWLGTSAMLMSRAYHIGVELSDGRVLVGGGCNPQTCIPFAEIFSPARLPADGDGGIDASFFEDSGAAVEEAGGADSGPAPRPTSPHPPLYRTGVTTCVTGSTQDLACPVPSYDLEDGDFQPNAQALVKSASDEVTDTTTGLVWQAGDDGKTYDQASAVQHCAAFQSSEAKSGWRLPSVVELMTLVNNGVDMPSIDPSFIGTLTTNYWTTTPTAAETKLTWTVKFDFGEVIPLLMDTTLPVRCVRGESKILNAGGIGLRKAGPLQAGVDTVQDKTTALEWQRRDDGAKRSWQDALSYCANLSLGGLSGWHLPNISELESIVQYDTLNNGVAIDPAFQDPKGDLYWTSTQNEGAPSLTWSITFNIGAVDGVTVSGFGYARCVRHLESGAADAGSVHPGPSASGSSCSCETGPGASRRGGGTAGALWLAAVGGVNVVRRRRRARRHPES
jgi:MYXO-CTERM domain-containing protein